MRSQVSVKNHIFDMTFNFLIKLLADAMPSPGFS